MKGNKMLKRVRLTAKIVATIVITLIVTSAISFWITQRRVNQQAEEAFRDKVRQITGMANATRAWFSQNIEVFVPGQEFKHLGRCRWWSPGVSPKNTPRRRR